MDDDQAESKPKKQEVKEKKDGKENVIYEFEGTRMKLTKPKPNSPNLPPDVEHQNGKIFSVNPETDEILRNVFGSVCPGFLEMSCNLYSNCQRSHELPHVDEIYNKVSQMSPEKRSKVHEVFARFHLLFKAYIEVFAFIYSKHKDDSSLKKLIRNCESHPRLLGYYRRIFDGLVKSGNRTPENAIQFLIDYHDSKYAPTRDVIINIITESPQINSANFCGFINYVMKEQVG